MNLIREYADRNLKKNATENLSNYLSVNNTTIGELSHKTGITAASFNRILDGNVNDLVALRRLMNIINDKTRYNKVFQI